MREVISLFIGQAGIEIGSSTWELYLLEHGIKLDGTKESNYEDNFRTFFSENEKGKYIPRALMVDLPPDIIEEVKTSKFRDIFESNQFIHGKEDSSHNFARARYTEGKELIESTLESIRKLAEKCNSLQGFQIFHSTGGGMGSGFTSLLSERLSVDYVKKHKFSFPIFPSPSFPSSVVENYNAILSMHSLLEHSDTCIAFDNAAFSKICKEKLGMKKPSLKTINRIMARVISSSTAAMRFDGCLNVDLPEFQTGLVPYPRIHLLISGYAPILPTTTTTEQFPNIKELTLSTTTENNMLVSCNPQTGLYMACNFMYRGDVAPKDVNSAFSTLKSANTMKFVDWCPTGFKCGIQREKAVAVSDEIAVPPSSSLMLANSTSMKQVAERIRNKFDLLFGKKAYVHFYVGEGMEEVEFNEAREDILALEKDYEEIGSENNNEEEL